MSAESTLAAASAHAPLLVLAAMLVGMAVILWRAQMRSDFDLAQMLRDGENKPSAMRLAVLAALAVSSWALMRDVLRPGGADPTIYLIYCATWSASPVLAKAIEAWAAVRGGVQAPVPPPSPPREPGT